MRVSIIIAVYNEAPTVGELLERVWNQPLPVGTDKEIVIVESNSADGSRAIVAAFQQRHARQSAARIQVIHEAGPRGKGYAVRHGFAAATGEVLLIQDADLEYDVADYPDLLEPLLDGRAQFVIGSRHLGAHRWKIRRFARNGLAAVFMNIGGVLFHALFNTAFGTRLTDPTSMYKVFRADCLNGLQLTCDRFDFDFELLARVLQAGYRPLEVPVSYRSRGFDEGKKIRMLRDPLTWMATILRCRFTSATLPHSENPARRASS